MAGWLSMKRVALIAVTVGIMNFVAFVAGTFIVGGDAINADFTMPARKTLPVGQETPGAMPRSQ